MSNGSSEKGEEMKYLLFAASLRSGSLNGRLANLAARVIEAKGGTVDQAEMSVFDCPSFDQDSEDGDGFPPGAEEFRRRLNLNDAFVIVSPEYNASMPGNLKNIIDWVSRYKPQPFHERHGLLLSASPSMVGGNRGLWALRVPLEHLGARVYPDMFSLALAHQAFDAQGGLANPLLAKRLEDTIDGFMELAKAAKHYPCPPTTWTEFLGEDLDLEKLKGQ